MSRITTKCPACRRAVVLDGLSKRFDKASGIVTCGGCGLRYIPGDNVCVLCKSDEIADRDGTRAYGAPHVPEETYRQMYEHAIHSFICNTCMEENELGPCANCGAITPQECLDDFYVCAVCRNALPTAWYDGIMQARNEIEYAVDGLDGLAEIAGAMSVMGIPAAKPMFAACEKIRRAVQRINRDVGQHITDEYRESEASALSTVAAGILAALNEVKHIDRARRKARKSLAEEILAIGYDNSLDDDRAYNDIMLLCEEIQGGESDDQ